MKLDDKIRTKRVTYLLKREVSTAFGLALLYFILARRRTAKDKISDACLKSIQWLKKAGVEFHDDIYQLELSDKLELLERVIVHNRAMIRQQADPLVHVCSPKL